MEKELIRIVQYGDANFQIQQEVEYTEQNIRDVPVYEKFMFFKIKTRRTEWVPTKVKKWRTWTHPRAENEMFPRSLVFYTYDEAVAFAKKRLEDKRKYPITTEVML